ncbi:uncharacterized protein LOC120204301 [Hibiscus syriacus]|uniref:uncharacterized protein LOC120204301 n=1 Tax=Hibiscus syriacus TaxID=106335 RepID=UPI001924AE07|nr:uncharacterized protein LOC120204301 [Hibiscus syriacus]
MGKLRAKSDYESLRNARILENQTRLASLGVQKTISDLRSSAKPKKEVRKCEKKECDNTPVHRSIRFKGPATNSLRRSKRLTGNKKIQEEGSKFFSSQGKEKGPAVILNDAAYQLSPHDSARRCRGKEGRCSVYNPVFGICCHFCSSLCLKNRKMATTGIAIYRARELGYKADG